MSWLTGKYDFYDWVNMNSNFDEFAKNGKVYKYTSDGEKIEIPFTSEVDLVPYYGYIVACGFRNNETGGSTVILSSKPYGVPENVGERLSERLLKKAFLFTEWSKKYPDKIHDFPHKYIVP